jgi:hypothetical protein
MYFDQERTCSTLKRVVALYKVLWSNQESPIEAFERLEAKVAGSGSLHVLSRLRFCFSPMTTSRKRIRRITSYLQNTRASPPRICEDASHNHSIMQTTHIKTTTRQAKADFRKHGPRISDTELRKMERRDELEARAERVRELEKKRKQSKRKREEKEERGRDAKQRMGIGLATQLAGFSHTQKRMKTGMEAFVGKAKAQSNGKENVDHGTCGSVKSVGTNILRTPLGGDITQLDEADERGYEYPRGEEFWDDDAPFLDDETLLADLEPAPEAAIAMPPPPRPRVVEATILERSKDVVKNNVIGDDCRSPSNQASDIQRASSQDDILELPTSKPNPSTDCPTSPQDEQTKAPLNPPVSPIGLWDDFLQSGTQITRELSQAITPSKAASEAATILPLSTQDLELSPTDLLYFEAKSNNTNPKVSVADGVASRDFAYFGCAANGNFVLKPPSFPPPASRSFSKAMKPQSSKFVSVKSPKIIASGFIPSPAERSFTSKFDDFGLSTQILQDAFDDAGSDTEEEDFMAAVPVSKERDRMLMPPPPSRTSPKIFKPPSPTSTFGGFRDFGFSTQILQDVVFEDVELSDEEEKEIAGSSSFGIDDLGEGFWDDALEKDGKCIMQPPM